MKTENTVSIVMCTYNGAQYLSQQLDTIVAQTYPLHEVIIQDDGSTDNTVDIIKMYAERYPIIKFFNNEARHGVNGNFFSAMRRATGDLIAISDQDDLWEHEKISRMVATIGDALMCSCRTKPFSDDGSQVGYDERMPNYRLPRLLFASILGHSTLFRRELLDRIVLTDNYYHTVYDDILGITAAACGRIVVCNELLVHQRRHAAATTISQYDFDKRRTPSVANGLYILWWSLRHYPSVKQQLATVFRPRQEMLQHIQDASSPAYYDALRICELEGTPGLCSLLRLTRLFVRHRHYLFYSEGHGLVNFARAVLFPVMQIYNYRYLIEK